VTGIKNVKNVFYIYGVNCTSTLCDTIRCAYLSCLFVYFVNIIRYIWYQSVFSFCFHLESYP